MTKKTSRCKHEEFIVLHAYDKVNYLHHNLILTEPEEEIGAELMQHARILKARCLQCNAIFLAKVIPVNEIIHESDKEIRKMRGN